MSFYVDDIEPMLWNDEAYDHLVYDEQQKDLVLSFVENHRRTQQGMKDVILGKGNSMVWFEISFADGSQAKDL